MLVYTLVEQISSTYCRNIQAALSGLLGPAAGVNKEVGKEGILGSCKFKI